LGNQTRDKDDGYAGLGGVTHDDELLWDVVAFLRKLPELTADQYPALVRSAPKIHDEMMQEMEMGTGRQ
jgi:hypothetical protein